MLVAPPGRWACSQARVPRVQELGQRGAVQSHTPWTRTPEDSDWGQPRPWLPDTSARIRHIWGSWVRGLWSPTGSQASLQGAFGKDQEMRLLPQLFTWPWWMCSGCVMSVLFMAQRAEVLALGRGCPAPWCAQDWTTRRVVLSLSMSGGSTVLWGTLDLILWPCLCSRLCLLLTCGLKGNLLHGFKSCEQAQDSDQSRVTVTDTGRLWPW